MHPDKDQDKEHVLSKRLSKILEARYENDQVTQVLTSVFYSFIFCIPILGYP